MRAPSLGQVRFGSFACRGRFSSRLVGCVRRFRPPPSSCRCLARRPSAFFSSLALSGFARSGLGVLVLVFSLFSFVLLRSPSCVPVKYFVISLSSSSHLHFLFIFIFTFTSFVGAFKAPLLRGVYVFVCVKHPNRCKACTLFVAGGPWALGWHGPTKTHPSCCANVLAIFESWWDVANPRATMPFFNENHFTIWIKHRNGWRWLLIYLSAHLAQFETAVNLLSIPFFCLHCGILPGFYCFFSILQGGDEGIFLSLHTKPSCHVQLKCFCTTDAFHIKIRYDKSEQLCCTRWI